MSGGRAARAGVLARDAQVRLATATLDARHAEAVLLVAMMLDEADALPDIKRFSYSVTDEWDRDSGSFESVWAEVHADPSLGEVDAYTVEERIADSLVETTDDPAVWRLLTDSGAEVRTGEITVAQLRRIEKSMVA